MGFWIFMFCMVLLLPVTMIFFGRRLYCNPPEDINSLYGYRTRRSMRNRDIWAAAGPAYGCDGYGRRRPPMLSVIPYTERMLKRTFDSEGNRISHTNPNSIT